MGSPLSKSKSRFIFPIDIRDGNELWIFVLGLLIRLLLMPFTGHSDLLHAYWKPYQIAFHQQYSVSIQAFIEYIHAVYIWLVASLIPQASQLWPNIPVNPFQASAEVVAQVWYQSISNPYIFRTLFLLKLPYLIFDIACLLVILRLNEDRLVRRRIFILWWLNPIVLYSVYIFGRHEVITQFVIFLSIASFYKQKWMQSLLLLGIATAMRYYALLLLPFYLLAMPLSKVNKAKGVILNLLPWLIMNLFTWLVGQKIEVVTLVGMQHVDYPLMAKIQLASWDNLYLFPLVYFLVLMHCYYNSDCSNRSFRRYNLIILLFMFSLSYMGQSPQYWVWFIPWITLEIAENRHLLPFHILQIILLFTYGLIGGRASAGYLFGPIMPDFFFGLPSPIDILSRFFSAETIISMAHTAFAAVSFWIIYEVSKGRTSFVSSFPSSSNK